MKANKQMMQTLQAVTISGAMLCSLSGGVFAWNFSKFGNKEVQHSLLTIAKTPRAYIGRTVTITARFAAPGNLFKDFNTQFNRREYSNFAIWPYKTKLWEKAERGNVIPTLYVPVVNEKVIATLANLTRYDLIEIKGTVQNDYANLPWIEVTEIKRINIDQVKMKETMLSHIRNGLDLERAGKNSLAAVELEMAVQDGIPSEYLGMVFHHLGLNYHADNQLERALAAFDRGAKYDEENVALLLEKAEVHLKLAQPAEAVAACNQVLKYSADYPLVHALMGEAYGLQGETAKGLDLCLLASSSPGVTAQVIAKAEVHRARVYVAAKRYREAVGSYAKAVGFNSPLAAQPWLRKEIGRFYEERFNESSEIRYLDEAITEYSNACNVTQNRDVESLVLHASALFAKARQANSTDMEAVNSLLELAESLDPSYPPALLLAGRVAFIHSDPEKAKGIYERLVAQNPNDAAVHLALAGAYEKLNQPEAAARAYQNVVRIDSQNTQAWRRIAELSETSGKKVDARNAYAALCRISPAEPQYRLMLARLALYTGEYEMAVMEGTKAITLMESAKDGGEIVATAYQALGDLLSAEKALRDVLAASPENLAVAIRLARVLADQDKDLNYALSLLAGVKPDDALAAEGTEVLAWVTFRSGRSEEAIILLESLTADTRSRSAWYYLGMASSALGRSENAVKAYEKVVNRPVQADEIKGIAEKIIEKARAMLPAARQDRKLGERIALREESVLKRMQLAKDLEDRRLSEKMKIQTEEEGKSVTVQEKEFSEPAENTAGNRGITQEEASATPLPNKAMAAPEGDGELLDPSKVFINMKDPVGEKGREHSTVRSYRAVILSSGDEMVSHDLNSTLPSALGVEGVSLHPELTDSDTLFRYIGKPKHFRTMAASGSDVLASTDDDHVFGAEEFTHINEVEIAPEWID